MSEALSGLEAQSSHRVPESMRSLGKGVSLLRLGLDTYISDSVARQCILPSYLFTPTTGLRSDGSGHLLLLIRSCEAQCSGQGPDGAPAENAEIANGNRDTIGPSF